MPESRRRWCGCLEPGGNVMEESLMINDKSHSERIHYFLRMGYLHGMMGHDPFPPHEYHDNKEYHFGYEKGTIVRRYNQMREPAVEMELNLDAEKKADNYMQRNPAKNFRQWRQDRDNFINWVQDSVKCPMRGTNETVRPFCKVGGYRLGGFISCEYETCFARFAKHISG
jgi:hypothetical protein